MQVDRPQTKQSSRKTKKAWRKNIDLDDIESGLEQRREELIQHGEALDSIDSEDLFFIDDEADEKVVKKMKRENVKLLKSQEILNQRSKVPGLETERHKRKIQGVDKKEVHKLMELAGKVQGVTKAQAAVSNEGLAKVTKIYDVWSEPESREQSPSLASYTPATKAPKTLSEPPIKVREVETLPHEGKSYNPSFESWQELIKTESFKESTKEEQKLALQEHQEKIQYLIENFDDDEVPEDDEQEEEEEEDASDVTKLSLNPAVKNKEKTKAQRNREQRHKERMKLETEMKELKQKIKELETLPELLSKESPSNVRTKQDKVAKEKKKLGTKHQPVEGLLEVKLSDELSDSLRKLKPEGNLLYDQMRALQSSGKVEARKPVKQKRKYAPKLTEKWTYKDFRG
ncbi:hypothetical protein KL918_004418 [Ogataea parapolymorpha]|uniref:Ribosome biogenesis protein NOP53 n=1 Tax=Ogataea parapolymorpha (strain ATCC 26012 / BCRC 20466 / JCM 22074 / NRRL Y-7560 / DL-1) TaxID=871575 RepID=W1QGS1_OGAPD|nr:Cellular protein [Ogataea parapolymorpha DL-1]ESX00800.1 Cellular protein [Ogataea parapolymorpha DL-1]KAG7865537.1 hypothetical protein KL918_004418 [Ogataea parapolymorpha]KAG7873590.1 hypothetical protein KL916_002194 [Ogataea parapolymorpha]